MGWVGYEGIDINWNESPVSSRVIVLSHRSEFKKEETRGARQHDTHPWTGYVVSTRLRTVGKEERADKSSLNEDITRWCSRQGLNPDYRSEDRSSADNH